MFSVFAVAILLATAVIVWMTEDLYDIMDMKAQQAYPYFVASLFFQIMVHFCV